MNKPLSILIFALVVLGPATSLGIQSQSATPASKQAMKDRAKLEAGAAALAAYRSAMARGDLLTAKRILIGRMIPTSPGSRGNYLLAARLCFELEEYVESRDYLNKFLGDYDPKEEPEALTAQIDVFDLLLRAAQRDLVPNWSDLPDRANLRELDAALERECRSATANDRLRTAKLLLQELRRLNVPSWRIEALQKGLDKRHRQQRAVIDIA